VSEHSKRSLISVPYPDDVYSPHGNGVADIDLLDIKNCYDQGNNMEEFPTRISMMGSQTPLRLRPIIAGYI